MKTRYFYNPTLTKTEDGKYSVDIYKYKRGKPVFVSSTSHKDYKVVLLNAQEAVEMLNKYEYRGFWKRLFGIH